MEISKDRVELAQSSHCEEPEDLCAKIKMARKLNDEGTEKFKQGNYNVALSKNNQVESLLSEVSCPDQKVEKQRKLVLEAGRMNAAFCHFMLEESDSARDIYDKVIAENKECGKAWMQRGECNIILRDWMRAKTDFQEVLRLNPGNKEARSKAALCEKEIKKSGFKDDEISNTPSKSIFSIEEFLQSLGIEAASGDSVNVTSNTNTNVRVGGRVPKFYEEYMKKYGKQNRRDIELLLKGFLSLDHVGNISIKQRETEEIRDKSDIRVKLRRYGTYIDRAATAEIGKAIPTRRSDAYGGTPHLFQTMKNSKVRPSVFQTGRTHVSLGCVDFSPLLFGRFDGDPTEPTQFYGFDSALVTLVRCKVLNKMIAQNAASRSILQVWFSSGWSKCALEEFMRACKALIDEGQLEEEDEAVLVHHWMKTNITLQTAASEWSKDAKDDNMRLYEPCGNLRTEIDRVDYARYVLYGYIFEENETNMFCGNRTMFAVPPSFGIQKSSGENFYFALDTLNLPGYGFKYAYSLKSSADTFMVERMGEIKRLVKEGLLIMTFEVAAVSPENPSLLHRIRKMNPRTVDWSNLPDYFSQTDFLWMAGECSSAETVHNVHIMNWVRRVPGTFIGDYPAHQIKSIILRCYELWCSRHAKMLEDDTFRSLWRQNLSFVTHRNLTENVLASFFKDLVVKDMFGDLQTDLTLRPLEQISHSASVIDGSFTLKQTN